MAKSRPLILSVLILLCSEIACYAFIWCPPDLRRDSIGADVICTGRLTPASVYAYYHTPTGISGSEPEIVSDFVVCRVLKGNISADSNLHIRYRPGRQQLGYGCFLILLKNKGEVYGFPNSMREVEVSEKAYTKYIRSEDTVANLAWEMFNSLHSPSKRVVADALQQLSYLVRASASPSEHEYDRRLPAICADIREKIHRMTEYPDLRVRASAYKALIATGQEDAIVPALDLVQNACSDLQPGHFNRYVSDLELELRNVKIGPDIVCAVASRLDTKSLKARRTVSYLLRRSEQGSAIPYLQKLLDDVDFEIRYNAVMGIALATGEIRGAPSIDLFRSNESFYINRCKAL